MRYMSIGLKRQVNVEEELLGRVVKMHKQQTHMFIKESGVQDIFMALIDEKISIIRKKKPLFSSHYLAWAKKKNTYTLSINIDSVMWVWRSKRVACMLDHD
jgi:hypothetical protein